MPKKSYFSLPMPSVFCHRWLNSPRDQTMYYFLTGYTAKVAGTERGIKEPSPTFSSCFGAAFLLLHPTVYAQELARKIDQHGSQAYLVNTGWIGGPYGIGRRIDIPSTRAIIDAILDDSIDEGEFEILPYFNLAIPKQVKGVDSHILNPRNLWSIPADWDKAARDLASKFIENFESFTLLTGVAASLFFRGFLRVIPVLFAVVAGTVLAFFLGMVDTESIREASWLALPRFHTPVYDPRAIIIIAPACVVVLAEHISHLIVTAKITGNDLMKKPGLHLSLLGDGISNVISGFTGSPPNTTYGENIGVMAITRVYSVWVIRGAALMAILFSLVGKVSAAISAVPTAVMGGITLLLYGVIAVQGLRIFVEQQVDFSKNKNMVLGALTFVAGVSGATIHIGVVHLRGMALAAVVGMGLALLLWAVNRITGLQIND